MKFAISCLSLVFCAFAAVFAEYSNPNHPPEMTDAMKVNALVSACAVKMIPITNHAQNVLKAGLQKSTCADSRHCKNICVFNSTQAYTRHYNYHYNQCKICFTRAFENKDTVSGLDCCGKSVNKIRKLVKADIVLGKRCMAKCDQPQVVVSKKNGNQDTVGSKRSKNDGSQTDANQPNSGKKSENQDTVESKKTKNDATQTDANQPSYGQKNENQDTAESKKTKDEESQTEANDTGYEYTDEETKE